MTRIPIRRALVSVSDKAGLLELARALHAAGVEVVSTGSTAAAVAAAGVPVTRVEDLTGFPECLDGRVKTLHPAVHAGILADLRRPGHAAELAELKVAPFELVVVNLYPFRETVASGADRDACVEQIDIGGPAMVRAAAKNHANVAVVVSPARYPDVLVALAQGGTTLDQRRALAGEAFAHTAAYDLAVATWWGGADATGLPELVGGLWRRRTPLRYGENPHQRAALYVAEPLSAGTLGGPDPGLAGAEQLHGKPMSYNNYVDTEAARRAAYDQAGPCVAIVKHANPCGIAVGRDVAEAHRRAHACDPVSAFGGVVAANRPVTVTMAEQVAEVFTEVLVAPEVAPEALAVLARRPGLRVLRVGPPLSAGPLSAGPLSAGPLSAGPPLEWRPVSGGLLLQDPDRIDAPGDDPAAWRLASGPAADRDTLADLAFAWRACRAVRSNAIVLARDGATVGVGMGQVNRVDAARLAVARAGAERAAGAVAASDAFFPFPDGLLVLAEAGVRAVVHPGGSVRDAEVTAAAADAGVTVYLTGTRHFAH
ncbi:MAG: bifunctional phosphoribosylaminoimidazolecarboxamide formyltransferase/IMP cyclohydrolase [Actinomycetota bacterium]